MQDYNIVNENIECFRKYISQFDDNVLGMEMTMLEEKALSYINKIQWNCMRHYFTQLVANNANKKQHPGQAIFMAKPEMIDRCVSLFQINLKAIAAVHTQRIPYNYDAKELNNYVDDNPGQIFVTDFCANIPELSIEDVIKICKERKYPYKQLSFENVDVYLKSGRLLFSFEKLCNESHVYYIDEGDETTKQDRFNLVEILFKTILLQCQLRTKKTIDVESVEQKNYHVPLTLFERLCYCNQWMCEWHDSKKTTAASVCDHNERKLFYYRSNELSETITIPHKYNNQSSSNILIGDLSPEDRDNLAFETVCQKLNLVCEWVGDKRADISDLHSDLLFTYKYHDGIHIHIIGERDTQEYQRCLEAALTVVALFTNVN